MKKLLAILITLGLLSTSVYAQVWKPDVSDKLELSVAQAIIKANESDPTLTRWFESAYAYAVFPKIGKGGFIVGGAGGKGSAGVVGGEFLNSGVVSGIDSGLQLLFEVGVSQGFFGLEACVVDYEAC